MKQTLGRLVLVSLTFFLGALATFFGWIIFLILLNQLPRLRQGELFVVEQYQPTDIQIDVRKTVGEVKPIWAAFAQGGEETSNMLAGTELLLKQINPAYVRLDHIFDDDYYAVVSGSSGNLSFNWKKLDEAVNSILASGGKPFFALSYMPKALAASKIDMPYNWSDWQQLVEQTIKHYSGDKGIQNVYYEVWNEPDLESFGSWKYGGGKNYLALYAAAARGAQAARRSGVQPFKIGGPATTALYRNWIMALTTMCQSQRLPLDFISWHRYAYQPAQFEHDLKSVKSWLGNNNYELIISELGPDPGKTSIYAGRYAAAHEVAVMRSVLDTLTWGFAFEVKDGPGQGTSGWGIFTHDSVGIKPKPRYYSLAFMQDMVGSRLDVSGEGSNIYAWAVGDPQHVSVIAANFTPTGGQKEEFPVELVNIDPGQYRLQWETLSGQRDSKMINVKKAGNTIREYFSLADNDVLKIRLTLLEPYQKQEARVVSNPSSTHSSVISQDGTTHSEFKKILLKN